MSTIVRTQAELDAAIEAQKSDIVINSPAGVWIRLTGSSSVEARDSSRVVAWHSSSVEARDSSRVEAWHSSSVEAWHSSSVVAWHSSRVEAWHSSSVVASKYVAIHLHSKRVSTSGDGHIIDITDIDPDRVADWIAYHGVTVEGGNAIVYKAVDADLNAGHGYTVTNYPLGGVVTAPDWVATQACGAGLHFGYRPAVARNYFNGEGEPRFLACAVEVETMIALGDKAKAPSCSVLYEVDIHGDRVEVMP